MFKNKLAIVALFLTLYACKPMDKQAVDLILLNGRVYTVDSTFMVAEAFAVKDGRFVAVGSTKEIQSMYSSDIIHDAGGKAVFPGFIDGHCHFYGYGENLYRYADLSGATSFDEVLNRLKLHYEKHPSDWILGRGWDHNLWQPQQFPDNERLDEVFPGKKVLLIRIDGHASLASKTALKAAGITSKTKIQGGEVLLNSYGQPTGILIDNADAAVKLLVPKLTDDEKKTALMEAQRNCFAAGLTSVVDAGLPYQTIELIRSLQDEGSLKIRINAMIDPDSATLDFYLPKGPQSSEKLAIRSVKMYADGALGSRGAKLKEPYTDAPEKTGLMMYDSSYYKGIMQRAYIAGFQVNMHAIGDEAVRTVLELYSDFLKGPNDLRWRIEHAQVVDSSDFHLFGDYSIIPSIQSTHATSDMGWADERLGTERIKGAYAQKKLLAQNGWIINGTDFPIESINPIYTFYAGVVRKNLEGWPEAGFQMENALSRQEAIRSMTIWAAKGSFEEQMKGSIEAGKLADFVILDKDLMEIRPEEILNTKPLAVFSSGEKVYQVE